MSTVRPPLARSLRPMLLAAGIAVLAYLLAGLGARGRVPAAFPLYATSLAGGLLACWLVARRLAPDADPFLLPPAGVLIGLGFAEIFRISGDLAAEQATWIWVGVAAFAATLWFVRDHRQLDAFTYLIGALALAMLLLPTVPGIGRTINGARLWVALGPIGFQPAEIAKVLVVVFLASALELRREVLAEGSGRLGIPPARHLAPVVLAWGASLAVLFFQRDMGASLLFFAVFVTMLWVATGRAAYLAIGGGLFAVGAFAGWLVFDHVRLRVDVWLHALDPARVTEIGFGQLAQAQFGMATGGLTGSGLGMGSPKLIPFAATDFIFAAIGEELGLLGTTAVLLLFVVLVGRGLRAALAARDGFGKLLAAGLATILGVQAFVIVGGVTRVIPLTGVTLPFVSYGGSSLVTNFVLLALLVRVSSDGAR
ncbi:MAG: FtsW/RodA/SpoVE family cell cycle protein [Actinomycetota bacterium]